MEEGIEFCILQIESMIIRSKTKIIFPLMTYGLLVKFEETKQTIFSDKEIKDNYEKTVNLFKTLLGHSFHIGGKYYDAYPSRNLPKYGVLKSVNNKCYELSITYQLFAKQLISKIPDLVKNHIEQKMGIIPSFGIMENRLHAVKDSNDFIEIISKQIEINATNFEVFAFAVLKIHLEKFACKIYRDTRTSAHDKGVDLSTNFGVVYQIKKLKLITQDSVNSVYKELQTNFSEDRIKDGNVVLIIDDITSELRTFLINMKIQSISKEEILNLASIFEVEERMKVLRIVFDEISREYLSDI